MAVPQLAPIVPRHRDILNRVASAFLFRRLKVERPQIHRIECPVVLPMKGDSHEASALFILPFNLNFNGFLGEFDPFDPGKPILRRGIEEDGLWRTCFRLVEAAIEQFDLISAGKLSQVVVSRSCWHQEKDGKWYENGC